MFEMGSTSSQCLKFEAGELLSFRLEEATEAVGRLAVGVDRALSSGASGEGR